MTDDHLPTRTEGEGETLDMPEGYQPFTQGQVLGERYQIVEMLGRGGMGEVWKAFDLKLRVEVALKALREDLFKSERRLELLRQEVRAAREVVSPNVCRIFDLIEVEGRELVSMEYVDGATLLGVLQERGPLELKEAQDIASQFLAGLEAIHKVGLIHRDIKPENIMLTRAGRVVVMDFGLARQETEGGGTVAGTPAYMAPEQAAGQTLDARADVYSAGVVLAEMVSPDGIKSYESRQSLWEGVRSEPAKLPDSPWAPAIKRAVARDREQRYNTAHTLVRALEDVTLRVEGAEDLHPYPGLSSFTEEDAEYFFGREAEVEQMWRKLERPHLLGIVGPSGAGKTSFIRAGVVPNAGTGWAIVTCNPGNAAFRSLRQVLASELAGDAEAMRELVDVEDLDATVSAVSRWRRRHEQALLIVDQFEELFTQNPAETQPRFAELLGRLVLEADVFVLLSMRDDFFFHCHQFEALKPVVTDLTLLGPPTGAALRRSLVQPATKCGYRFEDDELVEEMLAEVEGERGALPLMAFAAARLWEKRDRETGLLTRQAYHDIGGVGGALARHAEATIDRIGSDRIAIVRELFRNLITAEGTRAVREWGELLSVFEVPQRPSAEEILRELVDARLLTSYEVREEDAEPTRRVEIIHESLLANWPRLVRWQTQDADAAQLRDQLRQAARTWDEQGRTDDTLWTGSAYREFAVWREGYPGGLTEAEEAFAAAMTFFASRRKRRRRIAAAAAFVLALAIATVFGTLWRRSVLETRRAEGAKLLALAQLQLEKDPTEALAFATSSLDLADTYAARVFAVKAIFAGPPAGAIDLQKAAEGGFAVPTFSPDGRWLAVAGMSNDKVLVYGEDGGAPIVLGGHAVSAAGPIQCGWSRDSLLVTGHRSQGRVRVWSMPEGNLVNTVDFGEPVWWQVGEEHLLAEVGQETDPGEPWAVNLLRWKLPDGEAEDLGSVGLRALGATQSRFDPRGGAWIYSKGNGVYARRLPITAGMPDSLLGRHSSDKISLSDWARAGGFFSIDSNGETILWTIVDGKWAPGRRIRRPATATSRLVPDAGGRWVKFGGMNPDRPIPLWDLAALPQANPLGLRRNKGSFYWTAFHPRGDWVVATTYSGGPEITFWPLKERPAIVVEGWIVMGSGFTPDGRYLVASDYKARHPETRARLWPVPGSDQRDVVDLMFPPQSGSVGHSLTVDPQVRRILALNYGRTSFLLSVNGEEPRNLFEFPANDRLFAGGFSPSGRLVAAASLQSEGQATLQVWDLQTDQVKVFDQPEDPEAEKGNLTQYLSFVDEATLYTAGANGLLRWNIETGAHERLSRAPRGGRLAMCTTSDRRTILTFETSLTHARIRGSVKIHDLAAGGVRSLEIPGEGLLELSLDGTVWVSGEPDGSIWVGRTDGGEPHLLFGHEGEPLSSYISPDLRWIASSSTADGTLRLWPMPDLSKPPLHTLPHDELIAKLHTLTNLRVVRDEDSATGWKLEIGPFPGWETVPEW